MVTALGGELYSVLASRNIPVPFEPVGQTGPGDWFVRGDPDLARRDFMHPFQPHSGQDGSWGVFLADNLHMLSYPNPGAYWLFSASCLVHGWIMHPSPLFDELIEHYASTIGTNISTYGGYVAAQRLLFEHHSVYDVPRGILTLNSEVDPRGATLVVLLINNRFDIFEVNR